MWLPMSAREDGQVAARMRGSRRTREIDSPVKRRKQAHILGAAAAVYFDAALETLR